MGELVEVLPEFHRWQEIQSVDRNKFDLTWRPDPREPAYIYVWGNKHIPGELKSTIDNIIKYKITKDHLKNYFNYLFTQADDYINKKS